MAISIVNGYFCASSCDVSKAKKGENPHPSTDPGNVEKKDGPSSPSRTDAPAVVFGGSLHDAVKAVDRAQSADPADLWRSKLAIDLLA